MKKILLPAALAFCALGAQAQYKLQVLHASDLEGGVEAIEKAPNFAAITDTLEDQYPNTVIISSGDNYIPGPFFSASSQSSVRDTLQKVYNEVYGVNFLNDLREGNGRVDISIMNIIGFDAATFGNHEFDPGVSVVSEILTPDIRNGNTQARWLGADFPYISANLDFTTEPSLAGIFTDDLLNATAFKFDVNDFAASAAKPKIAPSVVINRGGEKIGVVGATTQLLDQISSPGGVGIKGAPGINDMPQLAAILQLYIDELINVEGVNKVILSTHLQQFALEQALAGLLTGVDIIIAGGSDFRLADGTDVLYPGDVAQGPYPFISTDANGDPLLIVSTDGQYSYVGRLVVDFDSNGKIDLSSLDSTINGAYATMPSVVNNLWGANNPFAKGTKGYYVKKLTDEVKGIVIAKDANTFGYSNVFLEGRRTQVRTEETNLGNITADANLYVAQQRYPMVKASIKNGGGIRAEIGEVVEVSPGVFDLVPTQANSISGKDSLEVSQLDIENSLKFNNRLSVLDLTAAGFKQILEHGVAATAPGATPGQFPQVGGIRFSFDPKKPAGSRVWSVVCVDMNGNVTDTLVKGGKVYGDENRLIQVVTLNFLAGGGDGYPFDILGSNRIDLNNGSFTGNATFAEDGSEQDAIAEYLAAFHATEANAYGIAETAVENDRRIQNLMFRNDSLLPFISQTVVSDSNWSKSTMVGPSNLSGYWAGAGSDLPADSTYTMGVMIGQPYGYPSINTIEGTEVIKTGHSVTYFKTEFCVYDTTGVYARFRTLADDQAEIYLNGSKVATMTSFGRMNYKMPAHDVWFDKSGSAKNGFMGGDSYGMVTQANVNDALQFGANTLVVAVRNLGKSSDKGGFSFRMDLTKNAPVQPKSMEATASVSSLDIYPNPTNGAIVVRLPQVEGVSQHTISLFDMNGRVLSSKEVSGHSLEMDLSSYANGVYFIKINSGETVITEKVVKN